MLGYNVLSLFFIKGKLTGQQYLTAILPQVILEDDQKTLSVKYGYAKMVALFTIIVFIRYTSITDC